jgi:hypothetical protein
MAPSGGGHSLSKEVRVMAFLKGSANIPKIALFLIMATAPRVPQYRQQL